MRDHVWTDERNREQRRWVESLDEGTICSLASSFHGGDPCTIFQDRRRGSFNVCFFVQFTRPPHDRWVVRLPIAGAVPQPMLDEKLEIELATMRYVAAKTTIPVPKVHAYAFSNESAALDGHPFVIMDFVAGQDLNRLGFGRDEVWGDLLAPGQPQTPATRRVHEQIADVYVQLRRLEFPRIGALGVRSRRVPLTSCSPDEIVVCNRPLSVAMAGQERSGYGPLLAFPPRTTFSTASAFVKALLWLADNYLDKAPHLGMDVKEPKAILYAAHHFKWYVRQEWLDHSRNLGPFVLAHGDIDQVLGNTLFDDDYNLVGVVDWEWSWVVPAQFLVPPSWLAGDSPGNLLYAQDAFNEQCRRLLQAVREQPARRCHSAITLALKFPRLTYYVYWDYVFKAKSPRWRSATEKDVGQRQSTDFGSRIAAFMAGSQKRWDFLARKIREQVEFFEAERVRTKQSDPRQITDRPHFCLE
ncbi:uncharacterized protein THITE_2142497 [Thermothielavioides terrestris NRRL 8126]|uniref:Aminoglycoside phosphotransferase domain-containing protein n=1 Tax=Thermothielavioides terrestris (strain ATCC 38088 / NRRL 8126) TaxID=578455 RepID=G2QV17_THETT|nr:uncharacterized protein THITE_2142497 [Thermothielavioides terrestris NRRL 8126]AEO64615.1 hypothetical protein THITE_2142497 [Thermothielavioides terrestris NRRL 8126]